MQTHRRSAIWGILASSALAMLACAAQAAPPPPASTPKEMSTAAPSDSPDARGRAVLQAQLAALDDKAAFAATFAPAATVLTPSGANEVHEPDSGIYSISGLHPHAEIQSATFDHFASGSAGQLAWFAADLHVRIVTRESDTPSSVENRTVRAIELLDGTAGWKVVVAAFTRVGNLHDLGTSYIRDRDVTDVGPLARLMTSPPALAGALGDGALVYGTDPDERGLGTKDARALLARWKGLALTFDESPKVHEVRDARYGYAMGNVQLVTKPGGPRYLLNAFLLALPTKNGKWSVVGASYGAL